MRMYDVPGYNTLQKNYVKRNEFYLDKIVSRILAEILFETRTSVDTDPNTILIDARYYKVVYLRNERKYLIIGRKTEKLAWENLPSSVKTMIKRKNIEVIVE